MRGESLKPNFRQLTAFSVSGRVLPYFAFSFASFQCLSEILQVVLSQTTSLLHHHLREGQTSPPSGCTIPVLCCPRFPFHSTLFHSNHFFTVNRSLPQCRALQYQQATTNNRCQPSLQRHGRGRRKQSLSLKPRIQLFKLTVGSSE